MLTDREVQVILKFIDDPNNDAVLAKQLNITSTSVKGHLRRIMAKTETRSRAELAVWSFRNGFSGRRQTLSDTEK